MTGEEAKKIMETIKADCYIISTDEDKHAFNMAIKAIDVLNKIRDEIADLDDADYDYEGYYKAVTDAVKIIDKYKERSE